MTDRPTPERLAEIRAEANELYDPSWPYIALAGRSALLVEVEFLTAERDAARAELAEIRERFAIESDENAVETLERTIRAATRCTERAEKAEAALGHSVETIDLLAKRAAKAECERAALRAQSERAEAALGRAMEALRRAHGCATLRDDGTCAGCHVSEALSDPTGAKALKLWQAMRSVVAAAYGCVYSTDEISGLCDCLAALAAIEAEDAAAKEEE